jgi:hypothetical protein
MKSYGCLKFQGEVWAGRACAGANQQELTTCTKSRGQERKKISRKMGTAPQAQVSIRGWRATAGRWPALAHRPRVDTCACGTVQIFLKFFYLKKKNFWKFG